MKQSETAWEMNRKKILSFPARNTPKSEVKQKSGIAQRIKERENVTYQDEPFCAAIYLQI